MQIDISVKNRNIVKETIKNTKIEIERKNE